MKKRAQAKRRGRPIGHKLSTASRKKISQSKSGYEMPQDVKERISKALKQYNECVAMTARKGLLAALLAHSDSCVAAVRCTGEERKLLYLFDNPKTKEKSVTFKNVVTYEVEAVKGRHKELVKLLKSLKLRRCGKKGWNLGSKAFLRVK